MNCRNLIGAILAGLLLAGGAQAQEPVLAAGTYFGGSASERSSHLALAPDGSVYIVGRAAAPEFEPMPGALNTLTGGMGIIVVKMTTDLSNVIWSRYVGGLGQFHHIENAADAAATADGGIVVIGHTETPDFPTLNALDTTLSGPTDHVLFKLDADGNLVFSTYLGGSDFDGADSDDDLFGEVEIAPDGSIFVAGFTRSPDFPVVNAIDDTFGGFNADVFVMKLTADGQTILASTYLGDSQRDRVFDMELDAQGRPVIVGDGGPGWPYTAGAYMYGAPTTGGTYITTLAADLQSIVWSARILESATHVEPTDLAIAPSGVITFVGHTFGSAPVPPDAYQPIDNSGGAPIDAIALQLSPDGTSIVGGTYYGQLQYNETGFAVAHDSHGNVIMGTHFYQHNGLVRLHKFNPTMTDLLESIVIDSGSTGAPMRVDANNNLYLLVHTFQAETTPGALQQQPDPNSTDLYIAYYNMQDPPATAMPGDINGNHSVGVDDLLAVINAWGQCATETCPADIAPMEKPDGVVDVADLLMVINN